MSKIFFHVDVNSAFLSWSAIKHLRDGEDVDLRTIPAVVGGAAAQRHGVVLAKSGPAKKYGINTAVVYPHSFRHRFAKNLLDRFNDLALLADLMGHESIETTRIYLRRTSTEQQAIVDKIVNW